jgi:predicted nucleic acid-binding protein
LIVLDTTILSYAVGGEHPLREPTRRLMEAIGERGLAATTSVDVIQEFAHIYSRRRSRRLAAKYARGYATLLAPLLSPTESVLEAGLRLFERHSGLDAFDAVLAAAAIEVGAQALVSADRGFRGIRGLDHVEPLSPAFDALLRTA